jgi:hypothetical protein
MSLKIVKIPKSLIEIEKISAAKFARVSGLQDREKE